MTTRENRSSAQTVKLLHDLKIASWKKKLDDKICGSGVR